MTKTLRPLRVLVCGGRDFKDWPLLVKTMNAISGCGQRPITVIHGGARGADALSGQWASNTRTPYEVYPITPEEWERLGKGAGPIRNQQMLELGKPDLVVAFPGGRGTADMIMRAQAAGKRVYIVPKKETETA